MITSQIGGKETLADIEDISFKILAVPAHTSPTSPEPGLNAPTLLAPQVGKTETRH